MKTLSNHDRCLAMENLEDRRLMAASVGFANGTIFINSDNAGDVVQVQESNNTVYVQGNVTGTTQFNASSVRQIYFYGNGGNDYFLNRTAIHSRAYGDAGNDTLIGGSGYDYLDGGSGNDFMLGDVNGSQGDGDVLRGGYGNDYLNGGGGHDHIRGDAGDDTLHGGYGADDLMGGSGNDYLDGGYYGNDDGATDRLNGGTGADHFVDYQKFGGFNAFGVRWVSQDVIEDYSWPTDTKEIHREPLFTLSNSSPYTLNWQL